MSEKNLPEPAAAEGSASVDGSDVVVITGKTADERGLGVVRIREGRAEVGAVRPLEHGKPIHGEVVTLHPRKEQPVVYDVQVEVPAPAAAPAREHAGPARVATESYRKNWDAIWARDKAN